MTPILQKEEQHRAVRVRAVQPKPIRVAHLVTALNIGGLEMLVLDMLRHRGPHIQPRVICLQERGALASRFAAIGVDVETLPQPGTILSRVRALAQRLRDFKPHILHTHNPGPHLHGVLVRHFASVPVLVHTKHGRNYPARRFSVALNRLLASRTDCVVPVSRDAAAVALNVEGVRPGKLQMIHNGIDLTRFPYRTPRRDRRGWRAVTVARLDPVKDQATMLRACRVVVDSLPTFHLDIVGDGPSRGALQDLVDHLGLERNVHFHGFRDDVQLFLNRADYFLLSSTSEGISLTLLEAMASGLPAVVTDVGGNREVVVDGHNGYLVPSSAPAAFADAILRIHSDEGRLGDLSLAARRTVEREFDLQVMVAQYEALYDRIGSRVGAGGKV